MNTRPLCLYLSLLAFLGPALTASSISSFPIDAAHLAERICDEDPSEVTLQCYAIVKNVVHTSVWAPGDPASPLRLMSSEPVVTSCGLWNATLTFDPVRLRPVSADQESDVSAMVLEMSTRLRFANQETGETVDFALRPGHGAGPWKLSLTGRSPHRALLTGESEDDGQLVFEGCVPAYIYYNDMYQVIPDECGVCPEEEEEEEEPVDEPTGSGVSID